MKFRSRVLALALCAGTSVLLLGGEDAEARRLGGGASLGRQSANVVQRSTVPAPAAAASASAIPAEARTMGASQRWLAPLAGVAAGVGLAALFGHLGISEELGVLVLLALLAVPLIALLRRGLAPPASASPAWVGASYSKDGLGGEATVPNFLRESADAASGSPAPEPPGAIAPAPNWNIPDDFDVAGFLSNARSQFVRLQAVFDAADLAGLRQFTTPEMFVELSRQVRARKAGRHRTDVVTLEAELLGIETTALEYVASLRFHGLMREDEGGVAESFDEVWNLTKPVAGRRGWLLAGLQQLD